MVRWLALDAGLKVIVASSTICILVSQLLVLHLWCVLKLKIICFACLDLSDTTIY